MDHKLKCRWCHGMFAPADMHQSKEYDTKKLYPSATCQTCFIRHKAIKIETKRRNRINFKKRWDAMEWAIL